MVRLFSRYGLFGGLSPGARPPGERPSEGGSPPGRGRERAGRRRRRSLAALLSAVAAVGLCALAACALFVPGFVLGAEPPAVAAASETAPSLAAPSGAEAEAVPAITSAATVADAAAPAVPSSGALLVTLPWGSGDGQVGLQAPDEGLARGPEAVAVAPDGRVAILDSVNKRVVLLDASGAFMTSAPLALAEPRFLAVNNDLLYVLDCDADRRLLAFDWSRAGQGAVALPELDDVVTGLFVTDSGPCVEVAHESVFLVEPSEGSLQAAATGADTTADLRAAPSGRVGPAQARLRSLAGRPVGTDLSRVAKVTFKPGKSPQIKLFKVDAKSLKAAQTAEMSLALAPGRAVEHLVSVDGDGSGGLIVGARLLSTGSKTSGQPSLWLARLAPGTGASTAAAVGSTDTLFLSDSSFAYLGQPYVVAPDGRIYQPVAAAAGYSILVYSFASPKAADPEEVER